MKAVLEFDLNDPDDRMEHLRCVKATDMALVLWEIVFNLRKQTERRIESDDKVDPVTYIFDSIREEMDSKGIIIDNLIS